MGLLIIFYLFREFLLCFGRGCWCGFSFFFFCLLLPLGFGQEVFLWLSHLDAFEVVVEQGVLFLFPFPLDEEDIWRAAACS